MKNTWLKFGCFLTGYNYAIIKESTESSAITVKKYMSALLIVSTLWGFIGYTFTQRYLHGDTWGSLAGALVMVVIIIQIEKQIILTTGKNRAAFVFRALIGIIMAVIGSVILDQVIFKEDVEIQKIKNIQTEVNAILPEQTRMLDGFISQLDSTIVVKEQERNTIIEEVGQKPVEKIPVRDVTYGLDSTGRRIETSSSVTTKLITNPKTELISSIGSQIDTLRKQKLKTETEKLKIRETIEADLKLKTGFLDELSTLMAILISSPIALIIWILLFAFFLSVELFVLVNKIFDGKNVYDSIIEHQDYTWKERIGRLKNENNIK
jgi:hypothetical protein